MERHLSTGVATIVALMAAHRLAAERNDPDSLVETIAGIEACFAERPLRETAARPLLQQTPARHSRRVEVGLSG